jgi:hypothetical protein
LLERLGTRSRYVHLNNSKGHRHSNCTTTKRFVVRADEILTAFIELEAVIRQTID